MEDTTVDKAATCHLFRLPAELRNDIYELVYHIDIDRDVDLLHAEPPPAPTLSLVCRQTYTETKGYYQESRTRYYKQTRYFIQDLERADDLSHLRTRHLDNFTHLTLRGTVHRMLPDRKLYTFCWLPAARTWEVCRPWKPNCVAHVFVQQRYRAFRPHLAFWEVHPQSVEHMRRFVEGCLELPGGKVELWRQVVRLRDWMRRSVDR
ncbi:hypothetical protein M409DRAFT_25937 [Zasmidium cellare ATCC 36951]|uniref:F-box domain-containing protein n=1 Tax=Zasmidium cellare ATCC 36951 TaxID=1080233 RepID=A0A6A6CA94_ZASCE|nr:uncharacterized protein M409DRAFT_25937 [Zasmidium cellare ATCC 36951]KAF2163753.1 hypothetical protein M409DRAFT_25937 [Zasmidium cellare ATCC 36951]